MSRTEDCGATRAPLVAATADDIRRIWPHLALELASYLPALNRIPERDPEAVVAWSRQLGNVLFLPHAEARWVCGLTITDARSPAVELLWLTPDRGETAAFLALVRFGLDRMGAHRVEWRPIRDRANLTLARAAGMRREGVFPLALVDETGPQDMELFGVLHGKRRRAAPKP